MAEILTQGMINRLDDISVDNSTNTTGYFPGTDGDGNLVKLAIESGTWTPTLYGATTAGTTTYTAQTGNYFRLGSLVFVDARIIWTNATGTGSARCGGLPFTIYNGTVNRPGVDISYYNGLTLPAGKTLSGYAQENDTYINLTNASNTDSSDFTDLQSEMTTTGELYFSAVYQVA